MVGGGIILRDDADSHAGDDTHDGADPGGGPADLEVLIERGVRAQPAEDEVAGHAAEDDGDAGGDPGGQVQLFGGVIAHLLEVGKAQADEASHEAAGGQDDGEHDGGVEELIAHVRLSGEQRHRNHNGGGHGGDEALQKVGAVTGNVVDVVADEIGDGVGHAAVVLGEVVADLAEDVGADVRGLGVVASGHAVEHGHDGTAQRIGGDAHHRGVAGKAGYLDKPGADLSVVHAPLDEQDEHQAQHPEGLDREARDAAAAQGDFHRLADGQALPGLVGGADIGVGGAFHAQHAHHGAHGPAQKEAEP